MVGSKSDSKPKSQLTKPFKPTEFSKVSVSKQKAINYIGILVKRKFTNLPIKVKTLKVFGKNKV